jgi:chromosome segregation ATPase
MKCIAIAALGLTLGWAQGGNTSASPATQQETAASDVERFPQLRQAMEAAEAEFLKLNHEVIEVEIPTLLKRDRCHPRIKPEVDRVVAAMTSFHKLETAYWTKVAEANMEQIQSLESIAAEEEAVAATIQDKVKIEQEERTDAETRLKEVKKGGEETAAVAAEGEALLAKIQATQDRLKGTLDEAAKAQQSLTNDQNTIFFRKKMVDAGLRSLEAKHAEFNQLFVTKRATYASQCRPILPPDEGPRIVPSVKQQQ